MTGGDAPPDRVAPRTVRGSHPVAVLAAIAVGGALGALARYGLGIALPPAPDEWPWATFLENASGCLLMGVLMVVITEAVTPHPLVRPFLGVGVLGGYTTFSAYSLEVLTLVDAGRGGVALLYLGLTPVIAVLAVALGAVGTRTALSGLGVPRPEAPA